MSTASELLDRLGAAINALDQILLGDENVTVTLNGVTKPSISRAIHTRFTETSQNITAGDTLELTGETNEFFHITLDQPTCDLSVNIAVPANELRTLTLFLKQGTGNNKVNWGSNVLWKDDIEPLLSTESGSMNIIKLVSNPNSEGGWLGMLDGYWPPAQEEPVLIHGDLELSENPFDLGAVPDYNPVTKILTVTNIGDEPITGITFSIENDPISSFVLEALKLDGTTLDPSEPNTLNPGATFEQGIMAFAEFNATPEIIGERTGTLTITADGHDDIVVPLKSLTVHPLIHVTKDGVEMSGSTSGSPYLHYLDTDPNQTFQVTYVIGNSGNYPLNIDFGLGGYELDHSERPGFTFSSTTLTPGMNIEPGEEHTVTVTISPESVSTSGVFWVRNTNYMGLGRPGLQVILN